MKTIFKALIIFVLVQSSVEFRLFPCQDPWTMTNSTGTFPVAVCGSVERGEKAVATFHDEQDAQQALLRTQYQNQGSAFMKYRIEQVDEKTGKSLGTVVEKKAKKKTK